MPFFFLGLGALCCALHLLFKKSDRKNYKTLLFAYFLFFALGLTGIIAFVGHVFFPDKIAELIGWGPGSPFQFEVGIANLALGVLALLAAFLNRSFQSAALLGSVIWLWGDAVGHVRSMLQGNFAPGNAGIYFFADLALPLLGIFLYLFSRKKK